MDKLWKTEVHAETKPLQDKIDKQHGLHCPSSSGIDICLGI